MTQASSRKRKPGPVVSAPARVEAPSPSPPSQDTMLIHGISEDGEKLAVLRAREDRLEAGVVSKVKEGEAINGELVSLTPRPESPLLCDVKVELPAPARKLGHGGPAQVATARYRNNWDAIWSKPKRDDSLN